MELDGSAAAVEDGASEVVVDERAGGPAQGVEGFDGSAEDGSGNMKRGLVATREALPGGAARANRQPARVRLGPSRVAERPVLPRRPGGAARANRQPARVRLGPSRVAERPVLPRRPGNAGGGKGPQVEGMAKGSRLTGVADGLRSTPGACSG